VRDGESSWQKGNFSGIRILGGQRRNWAWWTLSRIHAYNFSLHRYGWGDAMMQLGGLFSTKN